MPLHRSARLFTLGLALAGTCGAQDTQDNKLNQRQSKQQQRAERPQSRSTKAEPRVLNPKPQKKGGTLSDIVERGAASPSA